MQHAIPLRRALFSVSDKTDLVSFARFLVEHGVELLSTGGSARALADAGLPVIEVADYTGSPEMLDGRVKTLHPRIHGGILGIRDNPEHQRAMEQHAIPPIDLVVVNLYPFEATVARGADFATCVENIDIGGPSLIRGAAKNHAFVTVVTDPEDYAKVMDDMRANNGATTLDLRRRLAAAAYARCGAYDGAISRWFQEQTGEENPRHIVFAGRLRQSLRYGENPHQKAGFYVHGLSRPGVANARQVQGKELSYNNINDTDAAFELVCEFNEPAVAIIKHANPCGVARGETVLDAYTKALACDPVSAFGGIVALNRRLDRAAAEAITGIFTEVVIAPDADDEALAVFAAKKNLRLLLTGVVADTTTPELTIRSVAGGFLVQDRDAADLLSADLRVVTKRAPTEREMADMLFAFKVCKHVKSNAIVYVREGCTVGIGAGQMSRVDSARIASWKSQEAAQAAGAAEPATKGSVVASDAFFPFADGLLAAVEAGATAVIQPGGSVRDDEVIKAADEAGLAMVFTGLRHFRH
ncbi:bifunctional phosphoribosylaminoimidazolecarboxamide formyltransferase/IMP cyclohydrolase [Pararhodospirillum photometricum]|uniref:Bifunctional purine biosynthesis protein PurH n=1 Tax=Pararhodospirillum photometricum DSM 122 TaxID=1150469 RepID=H6SS02_PARPM|nr:bifunctional phosphoribosylaminoimidazolecarboxamide formyltransferase/IMP cyclohydrolase [Pararhodospirillum photometricum]CCG07681.1 Bifunctional purine biosynthesis protein purH [Pararhodospirillum photometricum DSM 122]